MEKINCVVTEEKKPEIRYDIPLQTKETIEIACKGVEVTKASLMVGDVVISTIVPKYNNDFNIADDFYILDFFGGVPYRGNLVKPENHPKVALFARDGVPSLAWCELPASVTYKKEYSLSSEENKKEYFETVTVHFEDGETQKKTIRYTPEGIKFIEN